MVDFTADQRHAAVMSALLKSSAWLMLPTLLHAISSDAPHTWLQYVSLALALMQLFLGWRCLLDAYLFGQLANRACDDDSLDQMLGFLFTRQVSLLMLDRLVGARRLWRQFMVLTAIYWLFQCVF